MGEDDQAEQPRKRFRYTLPGASAALVFACLSFTPSLLPRSGLTQGAVAGISAAIGYGLGVLGAWVWRAFADRPARPANPLSWRVFGIVAAVSLVGSFLLGLHWQSEIRELMDVVAPGVVSQVLLPVIGAVLFVGLVALSRLLRRAYHALARLLSRWTSDRAARAVGWVVVVGGTYLVVSGLLLGSLADLANQSFSLANDVDKSGVSQSSSSMRSGSPDSLVPWQTLGREGRAFASGGPSPAEITALTGRTALEPIRVFAGLQSADSVEQRADLAVRDLERAGGFNRAYLLVANTTGSGWVSPGAADSFEYLTGGDSAIIGTQYSYLPSWISFLVDQDVARASGRALYDAVYARWSQLPLDARPKLIVFGESLGSFSGEAPFGSDFDMANRTDGALFTGPPNFNPLSREFKDNRDVGSLEIQPIYQDGRIVRFSEGGTTPPSPTDAPWSGTRVLYVQHPSDPIVYWSPNLILHKPDWLGEPPGRDVIGGLRWIPFVTFWQVTADLPLAAGVPPGHGHLYTTDYVQAWFDILQPQGWTPEQQAALQSLVAGDQS